MSIACRSMLCLGALLFCLAGTVWADTRMLVDDLGRTVDVPAEPQRVVTLHDALLALPLYEMGLPITGSVYSEAADGLSRRLSGFDDLLNISSAETNIVDVGTDQSPDLELIASLDPDLIIGTEHNAELLPFLELIAPTFIQQAAPEREDALDHLSEMAERFNLVERYDELSSAYRQRIIALRVRWPDELSGTAIVAMPSTELVIVDWPTSVRQVVSDMGFREPEWLAERRVGGRVLILSTEQIERLDVDFLVLMSNYFGEDYAPEAALRAMDKLLPGWSGFLDVAAEDRILLVSGKLVATPSFAGMNLVIDDFEEFPKNYENQ